MDKNKANLIVECGLHLAKTCYTCENFSGANRLGWGTCLVHKYFNEKLQEERHLTVHEAHACSDDSWVCDEDDVGVAQHIATAQEIVQNKPCSECQMIVGHKLQCSQREDARVVLTANPHGFSAQRRK